MQRTEILKERLIQMEVVLSNYIEFKKDDKKLGKFIEKKATESTKDRDSESVSDLSLIHI